MGHYDDQYEADYLQRERERRARNEPIIRQFEEATNQLSHLTPREFPSVNTAITFAKTAVLWLRTFQSKEDKP